LPEAESFAKELVHGQSAIIVYAWRVPKGARLKKALEAGNNVLSNEILVQ
jgi:hypothetical protein